MKRRRENDGENWASSSGRNEAGCLDRKLGDDVSKDLLAKLDDPPSNDGGDMSAPELEPKHDIFLSHSGKQKGLTQLLERELIRCGYCPFFDIRNDSLPKGKWFPELIFRAGRQCRVAVLILSEDFFNSKWPMLELATFVDAQKERREEKRPPLDIVPVYFKLTRNECRMDENLQRWQKRWEESEILDLAVELNAVKILEMDKELKKKDERTGASILGEQERANIQAQKEAWYLEAIREKDIRALPWKRALQWKDAMNVLGPANGINMRSTLEGELIDEVVKAVRGLLPPPIMSSDPGIQAKQRICEILKDMISRTKASQNGARVVGVYGVGGMGKTTFCKEMCVEYFKDFEGKVYHAELGRLSKSELQKEVLQKLTSVIDSSLSLAEDSKVMDYVRTRMGGEKVFLALDDVWPESEEEGIVYVEQAQYGKGSIVMVTARSIEVLLLLGIGKNSCFAMPELGEEDARLLFLHHAAPNFLSQGGEEEECIDDCLRECYFSRGGEGGGHFLPLALKVLGQGMNGMGENPRKWKASLSMDDKFDMEQSKRHPLYFILGRGYNLLQAEDQILFMDIVLCNPHWKQGPGYFDPPEWWTLFEWLSIVHYGTSSKVLSIKNRLERLKANALLENIGDGRRVVVVHDLYHDFAEFETSRVDLDARRVVWHNKVIDLPMDFVKKPSGNCWSHVQRVGLEDLSSNPIDTDGVKWQHFANVVVLELHIHAADQKLDLQELQCLRSLVVGAKGSTVSGLGKMRNLGWLELHGVHCGPVLEEISRLTALEMLRVRTNCIYFPSTYWTEGRDVESHCAIAGCQLNLEKCINLRELLVHCGCLQALPDLGGMKFLRNVQLSCPRATVGPGGLGSQLCALQEFVLSGCSSLRDCLPQLHEVVSLQILEVNNLPQLEVFPGIGMMTRLRTLKICNLPNIELVPGLGELVALENLVLEDLPKLRELPDMRLSTKLQSMTLIEVGEVWEQLQLLDMIPSQLRYFSRPRSKGCELTSEDTVAHILVTLDLHELYKSSSATVLRDIDPGYPNWCLSKLL